MLRNTTDKFGCLTKLLHWSIFILFVLQYYLVYRREYFPKEAPEKLQYILLHKSVGVLLLGLALLMLIWRHVGTRPRMPISMTPAHQVAAKLMHFLLYVAMLLQPISGILMGLYGGRSIGVFGLFNIPAFAQKNEQLGNFLYHTHVWCSYAIIAFVSLHVIAALYHHFVAKDDVLKRMI